MRAAKEFVRESLYNIEPLDAGAFVEYELREHFRLKAADTKALSAYQKELHKAYAAKKETRQAAEENGLPEWYEVTERGSFPACWRTIRPRICTPSIRPAAFSSIREVCTGKARIWWQRPRCGS